MFETLEPPQQVVGLRWSFVLYISYGFLGLALFIVGVWSHGLSQPLRLAVSLAMFILAVTWLITTLKTRRPLTNRQFSVRLVIFVVLIVANNAIQP
jgi:uncharacterized membrane protein